MVEPVTNENKFSLIQRLVEEEVIVKRERNLKAIRKGLEVLGFLDLVIKYPSLVKPYFVAESRALVPDEFFLLVDNLLYTEHEHKNRSLDFFKSFVSYLYGESCFNCQEILLICILHV